MDKMREEFSKHCQLWRYSEEVDENDFFVNATTQRAWDVWVTAWQASRAALVVELPAAFDSSKEDASYYEYAYLQSEVEESLDAAGVSYE